MSDDGHLGLSTWTRTLLPEVSCPVSHDPTLNYGFLHRLDLPSSGLILCGTIFSAFMILRWQLDTYRIERQYTVACSDLAPAELHEVAANIDLMAIDSRSSSASEVHGKPAKSSFIILAHFCLLSDNNNICHHSTYSIFIIKIRTGRRHQIRAHLLHAGYPTVVDAKYAPKCAIMFLTQM